MSALSSASRTRAGAPPGQVPPGQVPARRAAHLVGGQGGLVRLIAGQPPQGLGQEGIGHRRDQFRAGRGQILLRQVLVAEREPDGEGGACPLGALRGDGAAVQPDELAHQREPDAAALVGPGTRGGDAVKALEEPRHFRRGDTAAGIADPQHGVATLGPQRHADGAVEGELQGVAEQVEDDLLPHLPVDVDRGGQLGAVHLEGQAGPVHRRAEDAGQVGGEGGQVDRLVAGLHAAGLDPREVQQRVDELAQPQAVALDDLELLAGARVLRGRVLRGQPGPELLHRAHDQGERGAELVADVGEERGLGPVQLGQLLGAPLLDLVGHRAVDQRRGLLGDQAEEATHRPRPARARRWRRAR